MGEEEDKILKEKEEAVEELISLKQNTLVELGYDEKKVKKFISLPILNALINEYKERKINEAKSKEEKDKDKKNGFLENLPKEFGVSPADLPDEKPKWRGNKLWNIKNASAEGRHMIFNKDAATRVMRIHNRSFPEGFIF
jgi:hypothetical protein